MQIRGVGYNRGDLSAALSQDKHDRQLQPEEEPLNEERSEKMYCNKGTKRRKKKT